MKEHHVDVGAMDVVVIDKLFGPMIFADIRVIADTVRGCWVIERETIHNGVFVEWATVPAQIDTDFEDEES